MSTTAKWAALGSETTIFSNADLTGLLNNAMNLSAAYNNTQGNTGDGYIMGRVTVTIAMATAAAANTGVSFWFLRSQDGGSTYESGGGGYTPLRLPDLVIPAPNDTTQRIVMRDVQLPPGFFKTLILNNGTGQAFKTDTTSTGSKVTITPITLQDV